MHFAIETISNSNFAHFVQNNSIIVGTIFTVFIILCVGVSTFWIQKTKLADNINKQILKTKAYEYLNVKNYDCWCFWHTQEVDVKCSNLFAKIFDLDPKNPVQILDILNQLHILEEHIQIERDRLAMINLCEQFIKKGIEFDHNLFITGYEKPLKISGTVLEHNNETISILVFKFPNEMKTEQKKQIEKMSQTDILFFNRDIFRNFIDIIPIAIWIRSNNGKIIQCNKVYAKTLETTPSDVILNSKELVDSKRASSPYELSLKALKNNETQKQRMHAVIEGSRRYLEITQIPFHGAQFIFGYALDFTEIEESSKTLKKHIWANQEILHHITSPIAFFGSDKRLNFFNEAYKKLFQFEENWLHSKPTLGEILENLRSRRKLPEFPNFPKFKKERLDMFHSLLDPFEELVHQPDDQILRLMIAPHPLGGLIYLYGDVTDKLSLERQYNTLIAVQKETLDHLYEGILVFGNDYRIRLYNPALIKLWKFNSGDMNVGTHISDVLKILDGTITNYNSWETLHTKLMSLFNQRTPKSDQLILQDKSIIKYSYVPLPDGSHLLSFVDMSDSWRFEKALKEKNQALEYADRIKSDFLSHVSYELRTPLNTIIGFSEILNNQYFGALNERQIDYCHGISEASKRLMFLVNDILDLTSIESGHLSIKSHPIDLNVLLVSVSTLVFNRANDQGLELVQENKTDISIFMADEQRLKQALFNLLMNAIKFTPSGGKITLKADCKKDESDQEFLVLSVKDTGIGISKQDHERIFKAFEKGTKGKISSGVGVGLSLVKSLIELHNGHIKIESKPNKGTTINCIIPLIRAKTEEN